MPIVPTPTVPACLTQTNWTMFPWTLTQLVVDGHVQPLAPSRPPMLRFHSQDGRFGGSTGCNSFNGSYTLAGATLRLGVTSMTQVRCPDTVGAQETAYLSALYRVERFGDTLILASGDGSMQLTFHTTS